MTKFPPRRHSGHPQVWGDYDLGVRMVVFCSETQALRQARSEIDAYRLRTKTGAIDVLNLHR